MVSTCTNLHKTMAPNWPHTSTYLVADELACMHACSTAMLHAALVQLQASPHTLQSYHLGNDYRHIVIKSKAAYKSLSCSGKGKPVQAPGVRHVNLRMLAHA